MLDPKIVTLYDTIKTIENLPKTVENRNDFEKFIKDVFSDEGKDGIQLSTIHKAKGLEADNVFVKSEFDQRIVDKYELDKRFTCVYIGNIGLAKKRGTTFAICDGHPT